LACVLAAPGSPAIDASGVSDWCRRDSFVQPRHFQCPLLGQRLVAYGRLLLCRGETEHLHFDLPHAGRQVERVPSGLVRVHRDLRRPLRCRHGGTGNKLVSGANGTAELRR
jgi:hypothetical protein